MPAGRPLKEGVSFFPLDVVSDDKFELIESEHGIVGFGVIIKLYQKIYADNYYIIWDKKAILVFSNRINVGVNSINAIINSCIEWEVFSKKLFDKFNILTSRGIQKRFFFICKKRKVLTIHKELMLTEIDINSYNKVIYSNIYSQRKGKERKREIKEPPVPEIFEHEEQNNNVKNIDFSENITIIFLDINSACEKILELPKKKKKFNPRQWAQKQINSKKHPKAVLKILDGLILYWDTTRIPWNWCDSQIDKYNGNFNESESIRYNDELKASSSNEELLSLTAGICKNLKDL